MLVFLSLPVCFISYEWAYKTYGESILVEKFSEIANSFDLNLLQFKSRLSLPLSVKSISKNYPWAFNMVLSPREIFLFSL